MDKDKDKYRRKHLRAQWWHYGWNGAYFITMCAYKRQHIFGRIEAGKMILSPTGVLANKLWYEIPKHSSFVELGAFVVMPNHIHGILEIDIPHWADDVDHGAVIPQDPDDHRTIGQKRFQNIGKNTVSSIIGSYKFAMTKEANRQGLPNGWQRRFHDDIIRNEVHYRNVSNYIIKNPENWREDDFYAS